jgi:hypothetical protein
MCENSTRYNRTWNFGLCGDAEGKKTEKFVFHSARRILAMFIAFPSSVLYTLL